MLLLEFLHNLGSVCRSIVVHKDETSPLKLLKKRINHRFKNMIQISLSCNEIPVIFFSYHQQFLSSQAMNCLSNHNRILLQKAGAKTVFIICLILDMTNIDNSLIIIQPDIAFIREKDIAPEIFDPGK